MSGQFLNSTTKLSDKKREQLNGALQVNWTKLNQLN